jgi:hypothetical protein
MAIWLKVTLTIAAAVLLLALCAKVMAYLGWCNWGLGGHYFMFCTVCVLLILTFAFGKW